MLVPMPVLGFAHYGIVMFVPVMLIMNMLVIVRYLDMRMGMLMTLRQMQPRSKRHQCPSNK